MKANRRQPPERTPGFDGISLVEAASLRKDDPELTALAVRAARLGLPLLECETLEVEAHVLKTLAAPVMRRLSVLPLAATESLVAVAMSDAESTAPLEFMLNRRVVPILARSNLIRQSISSEFDRSDDEAMIRLLGLNTDGGQNNEIQQREAERLSSEQPVVKLVSDLIEQAIRRRASDVHIRPGADTFEVLYRIDGDLLSVRHFLRALLPAIVSRIKVFASMNLAEHRVPQDGRASAHVEGMDVDQRASVIPTINGEAVVIRILNSAFGLRSVGEIGFAERDEQLFRDVLATSQGMLLVTWPTGSGKSTTLYAALPECRK